jgi:hypothetical protein
MASTVIALLTLWVVIFGSLAAGIWTSKGGRWGTGFLLGAVFGLLGLLYVAAARPLKLDKDWRSCPHCLEPMHARATTCPHCSLLSERVSR